MRYPVYTALAGLWRERWINFLCMLSIATGLFLMVLSIVVVHNIGIAARSLPERFSLMVFVADNLSDAQTKAVEAGIKGKAKVGQVKYISKEAALAELKEAMEDSARILEGLEDNPLQASFEITLKNGAMAEQEVKALVQEIKEIKGVEDVYYPSAALVVIQSARRYTEAAGGFIVALLAAAVVFVSYSTVKILFYRKKEEIDTLKLLGATKWFIRLPFVIEGGVIGCMGGVIGFAGMLVLYFFIYYRFALAFPILNAIDTPAPLMFTMPLMGLALGVVGAFIAIGRIRY